MSKTSKSAVAAREDHVAENDGAETSPNPKIAGVYRECWDTTLHGPVLFTYVDFEGVRGGTYVLASKLEPFGMCMTEYRRVAVSSFFADNPFTVH